MPLSAAERILHSFRFDSSPDLRLIYFLRILHDLIIRFSLLFLPIFLFTLGQNLSVLPGLSNISNGFLLVGFYYGGVRLALLFLTLPVAQAIRILGYQRSVMLGFLAYGLGLIQLALSVDSLPWLFSAMLTQAVAIAFFWVSFHTLVVRFSLKRHLGENIGLLNFFLRLVQIASPALAGFLIFARSYELVFLIGAMVAFFAAVMSVFMRSEYHQARPRLAEMRAWLSEREYRRHVLSLVGKYVHDAMIALWPLYVLFILGAVEKVGYLYSLSLFIALILSLLFGFYVDHAKSRKPYLASGSLLSFVWLMRSQVSGVFGIALADVSSQMVGGLHWLFYDSFMYKRSKGKRALAYFAYRELLLSVAAVFFWVLFVLLMLGYGQWQGLFVLAAVGVLLTTFMQEREIVQ